MSELVSIIMPSYNTAKFIAKSIESNQNQTYTNWELLIVDDCSKDNTDEVVKPFLVDQRIKYFKNTKNSGAAVSRNRAIKDAKGKWIAFLDSDDLWLPEKLEKQIGFMRINDYHFSYTNYDELLEDGQETGITVTGPKQVGKTKMHIFNFIGCLTVMYDAEFVGVIQVLDLKKRNDWAMWLKVVQKSPCYLLDASLSKYRVRKSGSITHVKGGKLSLLKYHYGMFRATEEMPPMVAALWTLINLPAGYLKRIVYVKR